MPHAIRTLGHRASGPERGRARQGLRPRAPRALGGGSGLDRRGRDGAGGALGPRAESRARSGPRRRIAKRSPGPHGEPRLRVGQPGDRGRGGGDPARQPRRRNRWRGRDHSRTSRSRCSRRLARALVEAQRARTTGARLGALARLRLRDLVPEIAGDRGTLDRAHDGPVRREDGEGERHHPRGAGRDRARLAPQRLARRPRTAACPTRPAPSSCRRATRR